SKGLLIYDVNGKMIVRNGRFLELYNVTAADFPLGTTHRDALERLLELGIYTQIDVDSEVAKTEAARRAGMMHSAYRYLSDGRTFLVVRQPMRGGGWVVTFD
ncbi:diguanylate phosphodiesterase, partial [Mesorhizobium sp. M2D.F.Ca.ET.160.01.1.1]